MYEPSRPVKPDTLPEPTDEEKRRSREVVERVRQECRIHGGAIPFSGFMNIALYEPGIGYYSGGLSKFGWQGDFITAPEVSSLFAQCVARQVAQLTAELDRPVVLEFGAGTGVMAVDMMLELERLGVLPVQYLIVELSADLRARQHETVQSRAAHLSDRFVWLDRLPEAPFNGVIVANEVLDAMPVECFRVGHGGIEQLHVHDAPDGLQAVYRPADDACRQKVRQIEQRRGAAFATPGYASEFNPSMDAWLAGIRGCLQSGLVLLIDYGYPVREYYLEERSSGTLICHYRHRAHTDPLWYPGIHDITAFVDFTAVAHAAVDAGFNVSGYTSQAFFLVGCGLTELHEREQTGDARQRLRLSQQIKTLTLPSEMGERFKAMALTVDFDEPLIGFSMMDFRSRL